MTGPNHKQRRSRTFRVEILESRRLMSTAGLVSRPAAVVAPLARPAVFASTAAAELGIDPKGSFEGKVEPHSTGISFKTKGTFDTSITPSSTAPRTTRRGRQPVRSNS